MLPLFISIFFASLLYLLFKVFELKSVNPQAGVLVNYFTATLCGCVVTGGLPISFFTTHPAGEIVTCLCMGVGFSLTFTLMGAVTRLMGVAGATIISRMSLVIPAGFSVFLYNEKLSIMKVAGIFLALLAIYFTVKGEDESTKKKYGKEALLIPLLAFLGVGITDLAMKYAEKNYFHPVMDLNFVTPLYGAAFLGAICIFIVRKTSLKEFIKIKTWLWGILLGIANYTSIYFFLQVLTSGMEGSVIFPVNSVGIVVFSTLVSILFFKEKLKPVNYLGLCLALSAIFFIAFS